MADWPVTLIAGESSKPNSLHPGTYLVHDNTPALGTFEQQETNDEKIITNITYNPDLLNDIENFVATMAHELGHYLLHSFETLPPGGKSLEEHATDLCTVFMGFGIFLSNSAKVTDGFSAFDSQGWQIGYAGYLSEQALITALSINETLAGRDPMEAAKYLKPYLAKDLKKACRYLSKRDIYCEIMATDLSEFGDYSKLVS